ncbi:hypothetical protein JTE90_003824 [Oedothorax gibbosus]|uniref:Histone H2A/H2B/H3 domain-containing protein n=1 Tax=Oedothorax gibbosus TaxID=931172 RepID=A0AAV6VI39_9ARAC|nr:hypothetical protein JTE90_003824 [Oedothorax gibbosus]
MVSAIESKFTTNVATKPRKKHIKFPSKTIQFKRYILLMSKNVHGRKFQLSKELLDMLQDFLMDLFQKIRICLMSVSQKKTLQARDLETAVKLCLPGLLKEYSRKNARSALGKLRMRVE